MYHKAIAFTNVNSRTFLLLRIGRVVKPDATDKCVRLPLAHEASADNRIVREFCWGVSRVRHAHVTSRGTSRTEQRKGTHGSDK